MVENTKVDILSTKNNHQQSTCDGAGGRIIRFGADDPDAMLIELCRRVVVVRQEQDTIHDKMLDMLPADPDHDALWSRLHELADEAHHMASRIGKLPAHTVAGIQARAAAVQAMLPTDFGIGDLVPIDWHRGALDALLRDMLGTGAAPAL